MSVLMILAMIFFFAAVPMLLLSVTQRRRSPWLAAGVVNLMLAIIFTVIGLL